MAASSPPEDPNLLLWDTGDDDENKKDVIRSSFAAARGIKCGHNGRLCAPRAGADFCAIMVASGETLSLPRRYSIESPPPPPPAGHEGIYQPVEVPEVVEQAPSVAQPEEPPADPRVQVLIEGIYQPVEVPEVVEQAPSVTQPEEPPADPRVQVLIERLNSAIDKVNVLQEEKERAAAAAERARVVAAAELESLAKEQRYFLANIAPYHKARQLAAEAQLRLSDAEAQHEACRVTLSAAHLSTNHAVSLRMRRAAGEGWGFEVSEDNRVTVVEAGTPASAAGLCVGDLAVEAQGEVLRRALVGMGKSEGHASIDEQLMLRVVRQPQRTEAESGGGVRGILGLLPRAADSGSTAMRPPANAGEPTIPAIAPAAPLATSPPATAPTGAPATTASTAAAVEVSPPAAEPTSTSATATSTVASTAPAPATASRRARAAPSWWKGSSRNASREGSRATSPVPTLELPTSADGEASTSPNVDAPEASNADDPSTALSAAPASAAEGMQEEQFSVTLTRPPESSFGCTLTSSNIVTVVDKASPAGQAGLRYLDKVVGVDGVPLGEGEQLQDRLKGVLSAALQISRPPEASHRQVLLEEVARQRREDQAKEAAEQQAAERVAVAEKRVLAARRTARRLRQAAEAAEKKVVKLREGLERKGYTQDELLGMSLEGRANREYEVRIPPLHQRSPPPHLQPPQPPLHRRCARPGWRRCGSSSTSGFSTSRANRRQRTAMCSVRWSSSRS